MMLTQNSSLETNDLEELRREVKKLRRELKEKDRLLKEQEKELQSFFSTLSHEMKTPIGAIQGFTAFILDDFQDSIPEEIIDYLTRISNNAERLEALLKDLLLLSRLNIDEDSFERVNMNDLISDIILGIYGQYSFQKSSFQIQSNLPEAYGYREGLRNVFTNLIINALKYRKNRVDPRIEIGCLDDEFFLKFYVKDNGIGIPAQARKDVFEMFVRAGNKRRIPGSGLGLFIARRITNAHGGEVWVKSKVGKGSTFFVTLPKSPVDHSPDLHDTFGEAH